MKKLLSLCLLALFLGTMVSCSKVTTNNPENNVTDKTVSLTAQFTAKEGKADELREAFLALLEPTRKEKGCTHYIMYEQVDEPGAEPTVKPGTFIFHETWASQEDLDAHLASDHIKSLLEKLPELTLPKEEAPAGITKWVRNEAPSPTDVTAPGFVLTAKLTAKDGKQKELRDELIALLEPTRKEKGCIYYDFHDSVDDDKVFFFHEAWETYPLWQEHASSDHITSFIEKSKDWLDGELDLAFWKQLEK